MTIARRVAEAVFDHRYQAKGQLGDPCCYCGEPSDTMDHIPPLRLCETVREVDRVGWAFIKVPSCRQCNSHLGGKYLLTIASRRKEVREYFKRKYRKLLSMPLWDEDELAEMSPLFAQHIRSCSREADRARRRIAATQGLGDDGPINL